VHAKSRAVIPIAAFVAVACALGCGGDTKADRILEAQEKGLPLTAEERFVQRRIVTERDVRQAPQGSARRTFLEYWAAISYEDWRGAIQFIDIDVRRVLDSSTLVAALRLEASGNLPLKPVVRGVRERRGATTILYFVRTNTGKLRPTSSAWRRRDGRWYMIYSATLDDSYSAAAQQVAQSEVDPQASVAARRALRAAARAVGLQAKTLSP
jgi:hypothetical protein